MPGAGHWGEGEGRWAGRGGAPGPAGRGWGTCTRQRSWRGHHWSLGQELSEQEQQYNVNKKSIEQMLQSNSPDFK